MSDMMSYTAAEKRAAQEYLVSKGWSKIDPVLWQDPLDPENSEAAYFFNQAWDIQYERDRQEYETGQPIRVKTKKSAK